MRALGYIYRKKGRETLSGKDIVLSASMDLGWFSPKDAEKLLAISQELRLLKETDEGLKPNFDYKSLEIPLDFKPSDRVLKLESQEPLFIAVVRKIEEMTRQDRREIIAQINRKKDDLAIEIEVAALLIAAQNDVPISEFLEESENEILKKVESERG